ncbi:MAG TPA: hypothetical protein VLV86_00365 [Vicinamibacterales bacterium]|nr:hypothetical protein [Vicinamibacterales bacterium]
MRYLLTAAGICVGVHAVAVAAQSPKTIRVPSGWNAASPQSADLADVLWRLAVASDVTIGLEQAPDQPAAAYASPTEGLTVGDALDSLLGGMYEWREIDGVFVVRPAGAWTDRRNPLNQRFAHIHVSGLSSSSALVGIRNAIFTGRFVPSRAAAGNVALSGEGATAIDLLNQLARVVGQSMWLVSSNPPTSANRPGYVLQLRDTQGITAVTSSLQRPLTARR